MKKVKFVLQEVTLMEKDELKYVIKEYGDLYVMMVLMRLMLMWYVKNLEWM